MHFEYDGHDRLSKTRYPVAALGALASSTTDYEQATYDANGNVTQCRLVQVYANGGANVTPMDYLGDTLITEMNGSNQLIRRYVHGPGSDAPIVWYEGSGTTDKRWLTADERGSIVAVTNSSGNTVAINSYDEYGIPASTNIGMFQYTGQAWLPEVGLYYYKARIYSPTLGRFMQTDPINYSDGLNWHDLPHCASQWHGALRTTALSKVYGHTLQFPIAIAHWVGTLGVGFFAANHRCGLGQWRAFRQMDWRAEV